MKRILTIAVSLALCLSMATCGVFANNTGETSTETDQTTVETSTEAAETTEAVSTETVATTASTTTNTENATRIPVITYHHLCKASKYKKIKNYRSLYVTDKKFDQQMKWLKKHGWTSITTAEMAAWYDGEITLPKKSVLITFDDGCYSVLKYAMPILKKYNMKGTAFIIGNKTKSKTNTKAFSGDKYHEIGFDKLAYAQKYYSGLEFQSHTYKMHDRIKGKKPLNVMTQDQINADFTRMSQKFGFHAIAYPWGSYNKKMLKAAASNEDIIIGFTYGNDGYAKKSQNRYALRRIKINGTHSMKKFTRWFK